MPGVSSHTRDLSQTATQLESWFAQRLDRHDLRVSGLEGNAPTGFSNQTLFFQVATRTGEREHYVLRMPPAGEGLFPEYNMRRQWLTHSRLHALGLPTADPSWLEEDLEWLGCPFIVMPRRDGITPNDITYARKGWLADADIHVQLNAMSSFIELLSRLHSLNPLAFTDLLSRPGGNGLEAEVAWWRNYLDWASDGEPPPLMATAYEWIADTRPVHSRPDVICWNDARFANIIYQPDGTIEAALDWEQAIICPAELDIAFWLATRRQACGAVGIDHDPELAGFLPRTQVLQRFERALQRPLEHLAWHEVFAMVRMGTNIVGTQRALRRSGQEDHFLMRAPLLPEWTIAAIESSK